MFESKLYRSLLKYVPQEGMILDAGCGYFKYANFLRKYGKKVICLDLFIPDVDDAQKNNFLLATVESLPLKDNSFDFIYCMSTLQFVKDDSRVVNEFSRILKPGGTLLFTVPTSSPFFKLLRELEIACGTYMWPQFNVKHHHYYTRGKIQSLIRGKFAVIDIRGYQYNFVPRLGIFLISICRPVLRPILRFCRLYAPLSRLYTELSENMISDTTDMVPGKEAKAEMPKDSKLNPLWDKFQFVTDLSYHYIFVLKKL